MERINNKGFTLVELIATIVLLAIIMGIGAISITAAIKNAKQKDYELLIKEINNAVELYYQECRYSKNDLIVCPVKTADGYYAYADFDGDGDSTDAEDKLTLGKLVEYGFLKGNSTITEGVDKDKPTLVNPKDDANISNCQIRYKYESGKIIIEALNQTGSCPTSY